MMDEMVDVQLKCGNEKLRGERELSFILFFFSESALRLTTSLTNNSIPGSSGY